MIASRSFLFSCDQHIQNPESESQRLPPLPQNHGETVYVHPTAIKHFVRYYLHQLHYKIILVSGDSDMTVPDDIPQAQTVLNHPMIIKWYSQNCVRPGGKLCQLPIGLYFHVIYNPLEGWCYLRQNIQYYETLINTLKQTPKQNKCFSNFHFVMNTKYGKDRIDAINSIPRNLIDYQPVKITSEETWELMSSYKFIVSPHGNGLDCHRTWEALCLGCFPIVRTSPLDPLFEGLPVLIVQKWSDITQDLLDNFQPNYSQIGKLTLDYWSKKFKE